MIMCTRVTPTSTAVQLYSGILLVPAVLLVVGPTSIQCHTSSSILNLAPVLLVSMVRPYSCTNHYSCIRILNLVRENLGIEHDTRVLYIWYYSSTHSQLLKKYYDL